MIKNTASQKVGVQMVSATDGSAFTGAVTVSVTGDAGTQATGSVGAGACTHEGNGYHTYAPAQAETNYDLIAFTFTGSGAIPATVQVYTIAGAAALEATAQSILNDTAEIGAAGAGLTNINLPNQTMDIVGNITGNVSGSVGSVTGAVGSVTAGVTLAASAVQAIWDALTSALTTAGSIGKLIVDNLNATISSRLATAGYTAPPSVGAIADQVWEEAIADHSGTAGSVAEALNAAGAAGDPWTTQLPGAYGAGSAGKIVGDNVNATISSRATQTSVDDLPTNAELATSQAAADDATLAAIAALNNLSSAQAQTAATAALTAYDPPTQAEMDAGLAALNNLSAADVRTAVGLASANLDTQLAAIAAFVDTEVAAIISAIAALNNISTSDVLTQVNAALQATLADSIPADGTRPSISSGIYMLTQFMLERSVSGTTCTIKKADGSTTLFTLTLNDATTPTSITRTT